MAPLRLVSLVCGAAGVLSLSVDKNTTATTIAAGIHPELSPKSDKKFFGKDYGADMRPGFDAAPKWTAPYPKVQSPEKFDKDYVKDENADGGHWKAQMDYDTLKMKYYKQQQIVQDLAKQLAAEKGEALSAEELARIKDGEKAAADNAAAQAAAEAAAANGDLSKANADENAAEGEHVDGDKSAAVAKAEQDVIAAEAHLKDCQAALDAAKARLEEVKAQDAAKFQAAGNAKNGRVADAKARAAAAKANADGKNANAANANATAGLKAGEASAAHAALDKEQGELGTLQQQYDAAQSKLGDIYNALLAAEDKLREFRGEPPRNALYSTKSAASGLTAGLALVSAVVACTV